jgi:hypothetical protein
MELELYFATLLETSGAETLLLVRDDATSSPLSRKEYVSSVSYPILGPPSCPRRKKSNDNLIGLPKPSRREQNRSRAVLKSFFDDVKCNEKQVKPTKKIARWDANAIHLTPESILMMLTRSRPANFDV